MHGVLDVLSIRPVASKQPGWMWKGRSFDMFDAFDVDGPYGWDELPRRSQGGFFLLGDISGLCGLVPGPTRFTGPLDAATGTHREGNKA